MLDGMIEDTDEDYTAELNGTYDWEYAGSVGVDSGQLMIVDPCYVDDREGHEGFSYDAWLRQLFAHHDVNREDHALEVEWSNLPGGAVISPTAYGDGGYPVWVRRNSENRICAMQVIME